MTTEATKNLVDDVMDSFAKMTAEQIEKLTNRLFRSLSEVDLISHKIMFLLEMNETPGRRIISLLNGSSSNRSVGDMLSNIVTVTNHVISQNDITLDRWLGLLSKPNNGTCMHLDLATVLGILEVATSIQCDIPIEFYSGIDKVLVKLMNTSHSGIRERIFDDKFQGRLSKAIKQYFDLSYAIDKKNRILRLLALVEDRPTPIELIYHIGVMFDKNIRLSQFILDQVNYSFFRLFEPQEAMKMIKKSFLPQE